MRIGIVGAGILGQLFAFHLQRAGYNVTLFDQGAINNCSQVAAGLLTPVAELEKNDGLIYHLGMAALDQHWPEILAQLNAPIYFKRLGSLVLAHARDHNELTRLMQKLKAKLPIETTTPLLNQQEIKNLEPMLGHFQQGYYFKTEGQIDNQALLKALTTYLQEHIRYHADTKVDQIEPRKIVTRKEVFYFDCVVDCRGLAAKSLFSDLRGIRGEMIWLHAPQIKINRPIRLLHPRYSLYLVPRPDDLYLIGASEIESEECSAISVRSTLELLSAAYCLQPLFNEARIMHTATQCRPCLADHLPKIKYTDGLLAVNGLYRHGFLIAPTLVAEMMLWLQEGMNALSYPAIWEKCA
jgi:glycine oxidase